jgi:hypothetical protein
MKYTDLQRSAERRITLISATSFDPGSSSNALVRFKVSTGFGTPVLPSLYDLVTVRIIGQDGTSAGFNPIVTPGFGTSVAASFRGAAASGVGPDRPWGEFGVEPNDDGVVEFQCNPHVGPNFPVPGYIVILIGNARLEFPLGL